MARSTIAVIGAGQWGTTLAGLLAGKDLPVRLWVREAELAATMAATRENTLFLPGIALPAALQPTASMAEAIAGAELLVMAVPSCWMRATARALATYLPFPASPLITVTKGLEIETGKRMSEVIREEIPALPAIGRALRPQSRPGSGEGRPGRDRHRQR